MNSRIVYTTLYSALVKYCKCKRYNLECVGQDTYRLTKYRTTLIAFKERGDEVDIIMDSSVKREHREEVLEWLNNEIEHLNFLEKTKRQARPVTFPLKMCHQKLSWLGVEALRDKAHIHNKRYLGLCGRK